MAFWKSDDEKKKEMEEVKRQVEGREKGPETGLPEPPEPPAPDEPIGGPEEERPPEPRNREPADTEEPSLRIRESREPSKPPEPTQETGVREAPKVSKREPTKPPEVTRKPPENYDGDFAPLFVKIDKYDKILEDLEEVKAFLGDLKELFELMNQLDEVKRKGMDQLKEGISGLTDTLISMDDKFIRPEGKEKAKSTSERDFSETVTGLQKDLRDLRDSLDRVG